MRLFHSSLAFFGVLLLGAQEPTSLKLPMPPAGGASLQSALKGRATVRSLTGPVPTLAETGQLLWATQGENRPGKRVVPSAHAKYPVEVYLVTNASTDLPSGVYHYLPAGHKLIRMADGTPATLLGTVKGMQAWIKEAPAVFVMAGDPSRIGDGASALNLTYYEGGAAAQDLLLQTAALGLGAGTAAGVDLEAVGRTLKLSKGIQIMTLIPVGHMRP